MSQTIQRALLFGVILSAGFLGGEVLRSREPMGTYNCCGDVNCSTLSAMCACPNGTGIDCVSCGSYSKCCTGRCAS